MSDVVPETTTKSSNFIGAIIAEDLRTNKHGGRVATRFPPEPNGYLHIGHAKSIVLNFGTALKHEKGVCHLRFDDTNPLKEDTEYAEAIKEDVRWLGYDWGSHLYHASDYFEQLYNFAVQLIKDGKAYVCSLSAEEVKAYRGTLTETGKNSPYRDRSIDENLRLFAAMRSGEFPDGAHTLRAKIDMSSGNINMRDPAIYRIRRAHHHRTGDEWCIYPMYDYAHCVSDAIEDITHSLCTLEFEAHRPLYDWFLEQLNTPSRPQQIEFARLNLNYTVTSKRRLKQLVDENHVSGWDDPRMPTICGIRRRGFTPQSIRKFCERIGVSKKESIIDMSMLEDCVRDDLNESAPRGMAVLNPLKVVIESMPENHEEFVNAPLHPQKPEMGMRQIPISRELYIEREDFMENPPKKYFRLSPGGEVRLRSSYIIKCQHVIKNEAGEVVELRCTHDPDTLGKKPSDGRKVKGIVHWVSAKHAERVKVNLYDRLFKEADPTAAEKTGGSFLDSINPESLTELENCWVEPSIARANPDDHFQFERLGYFTADKTSQPGQLVFNRTATLRDTWAKVQQGK